MIKIAFIGAGSVVFTRNLLADILQFREFHTATLALMDIDPRRLRAAGAMARHVARTMNAQPTIEEYTDRREAVAEADFVIIMVQVGMHEATVKDFEIPARYGIRQTIADTLGLGGIFRFLRTAPVVEALYREVQELAPRALILNYTNPMAMLMMLMHRLGSQPAVGLCHSIQGTAAQLETYLNIPAGELEFRAAGINHMAWYLSLRHRGQDVYPQLHRAAADPQIYARDPVRFEILQRFGYFVSESSEHMAEYTPYFIQFESEVQRLRIPINEYIRRSEQNLRTFEEVEGRLSRGEPIAVEPSTEFAGYIMHSVVSGQPRVVYGNVENRSLIENLPAGCCVEVPCLVDRNGVQPVQIGTLPPQLAALNRTNIHVQELAVEAYLSGRREHILHAALLDPNTVSQASVDRIARAVDDLLAAHRDLLGKSYH